MWFKKLCCLLYRSLKFFLTYKKMRNEAQDSWWEPRPENHLIGEIWDPRARALQVGAKNWDLGPISEIGSKTQDLRPWSWDPRPSLYVEPKDWVTDIATQDPWAGTTVMCGPWYPKPLSEPNKGTYSIALKRPFIWC